MNNASRTVSALAAILVEKSLTLGLAESCTGGLISSLVTDQSGSSAWYQGGIVAYANEVKTGVLGVSQDDLIAYGAVSEAVVRAMCAGAQRVLSSACAVAVSGIAGPGGGTVEKPVGTVWIAFAAPGRVQAKRFLFTGDRLSIKTQSAIAALDGLRSLLLDA